MKASIKVAALALPLVVAAAPAMAFHGTYSVTFYSGPSGTQGATQCLEFTATHNIDGFPFSGVWTSSTYSGWGGNYIATGHQLQWYGTYNSGAGVTDMYINNRAGRILGAPSGYDEWDVSGVVAVSDGYIKLVPGCAPGANHPQTRTPSGFQPGGYHESQN